MTTTRNIPALVRSTRLSKTTKAFTLLNPALPVSVRRTLNETATAIKMLAEVDDITAAVEACGVMHELVAELKAEGSVTESWVDRLTRITDSIAAVKP